MGNRDEEFELFEMWQKGLSDVWKEMKNILCIIDFRTVVPFRRPYYRTSHCYSELSGDYWDKLSHPTITDIFAGIHAQAQASGKGIR